MLNGRYYVQAWADAWFQEKDGTGHHMSIPLVVFDTENYKLFRYTKIDVDDFSDRGTEGMNFFLQIYTGNWNENPYVEYLEDDLAFGETGLKDREYEAAYRISLGAIPNRDINSSKYENNIQANVEFWRDLIKDIYTIEQIEAFTETLDASLLSLNEPNLPANFIIPIQGDN